jgi:hypothetical protein
MGVSTAFGRLGPLFEAEKCFDRAGPSRDRSWTVTEIVVLMNRLETAWPRIFLEVDPNSPYLEPDQTAAWAI